MSPQIEYFILHGVDANFASTTNVQPKVYDILGREIAILVNKEQKPGFYEVKWNASNQSSGVYFYKLTMGNYTATKKMILIK